MSVTLHNLHVFHISFQFLSPEIAEKASTLEIEFLDRHLVMAIYEEQNVSISESSCEIPTGAKKRSLDKSNSKLHILQAYSL